MLSHRLSFISLILLAISFQAFAADHIPTQPTVSQELMFSWSIPTTRADGSTLSASDISHYTITYSVNSGPKQMIRVDGGTTTKYNAKLKLGPSQTPYTIKATIRTTDTFNLSSPESNEVSQTINVIPGSAPAAPVNMNFLIECRDCSIKPVTP